jgi:hypothetical protein
MARDTIRRVDALGDTLFLRVEPCAGDMKLSATDRKRRQIVAAPAIARRMSPATPWPTISRVID